MLLASACLRTPAEEAGIDFGYAIDPGPLATDPIYQTIVRNDATIVTPENHMKWSLIHPGPNTYDFTLADQIVATAAANGQSVRGHTLVWHSQLPAWVTSGIWTRETLLSVLEDHITTVVSHYRDNFPGVVTQWDVVNEAFHADGTRRDTIWQQVIGDDYIELALQFARAADPDAELYINDFYDNVIVAADSQLNGLPAGPGASPDRTDCALVPKCAATRTLATDFSNRGVPIDGIGFQAHLFGQQATDYAELASWVGPLGLEWAITELDVALLAAQGDDNAALTAQADAYAKVVDACVGDPACDTIVLWGVSDAHSWIPGTTFGLLDHGLLYDHDNVPKPALVAVYDSLTAE
ncbi:MAG: endo-1,4-beta-xylanase [Acidimicrobiales bacterium]